MELRNVPHVLDNEKKSEATGYEYIRSRQEIAEALQLMAEARQGNAEVKLKAQEEENAVLRISEEPLKRSVIELTEQLSEMKGVTQKHIDYVKELTDLLSNKHSRLMQLEEDKFFLAGDVAEKSVVEEELRRMCIQLQLQVDKLMKSDKEFVERCNNDLKRKHREHRFEYGIKERVLKAFKCDEKTASQSCYAQSVVSGRYCVVLRWG
jgi:hypothetical protein